MYCLQRAPSRWSDDSDEDELTFSQHFRVVPSSSRLEVIGAWRTMLAPMLDAYYTTAASLNKLVGTQIADKEFISNTQNLISAQVQKGTLRYGKWIVISSRSCLRSFACLYHEVMSFLRSLYT